MIIKEVDFNNIAEFHDNKVEPVFMQYGKECFEFPISLNQIENLWPIFQKLFYYKLYLEKPSCIEPLFDARMFKNDVVIFSRSDKVFKNLSENRDKSAKFGENAYIAIMLREYNNLVILKKMLNLANLSEFKLFVVSKDDFLSDNLEKEFSTLKKKYNKCKNFQIKKANLVVGYINSLILTEEEKLVRYVGNEYKTKLLLGDIILTNEQEKVLNEFMRKQLKMFVDNTSNFKPEYQKVFTLGLVRYAMKYYNTKHTGDFWPYFKLEYGIEIPINKQKQLHKIFGQIMMKNNKIYDRDTTNKIDNITMHSFVSDNSAFQFFDYLLAFWRLDLGRNADKLNNSSEYDQDFNTLIESIKNGMQNIMAHTSLLLNFDSTIPSFKNRIKRILKLINDAFWDNKSINITGNRINSLLNDWINNINGDFQKEKEYVKKHSIKERGTTLFHSPVFMLSTDKSEISIVLPRQRLINCTDQDNPVWIIKYKNNNLNEIDRSNTPTYKHDKISYYVEKEMVNIPLNSLLKEFNIELLSNGKMLKKYKINSANIRLFDENGKWIDYKTQLIPAGNITSYSNNREYPYLLDETVNTTTENDLYVKEFSLINGQVIVVDDQIGLQIGQKIEDGLIESYPISGVKLLSNNKEYLIYNKIPKIILKTNKEKILSTSIVINGKQNKIDETNIKEFKLNNDVKMNGYIIELGNYIINEGLYSVELNFTNGNRKLGDIAYIPKFNYSFEKSPYVFKDTATIVFDSKLKFVQETENIYKDLWNTIKYDKKTFTFIFDKNNRDCCNLVQDRQLKLDYNMNGSNKVLLFDIPAFYWKFSQSDEWNTNKPANILLKDIKNSNKKLYVSGPFDFKKSRITTNDDIDIATEENFIKIQDAKKPYYDLSLIYDWFRNNRNEVYRGIEITINEQEYSLFYVICKSRLKGVNLVGDFTNNKIYGDLLIDGDESYSITITYNDEKICEDYQVENKKFCIDANLRPGNYSVLVYETINEDDDEFDISTESIQLNKKPITKRLINISNLYGKKIILRGYSDLENKYDYHKFGSKYAISKLNLYSYERLKELEPDLGLYGLWNNDFYIDEKLNEKLMSSFRYYTGELGFYLDSGKYKALMNVLIIFPNKLKPESIIILPNDGEPGQYGNIVVNRQKEWIIPLKDYNRMSKFEKYECYSLFDDKIKFDIDIEDEENEF